MSIADVHGTVSEPTSIDTWRTVLNAVIDDVQECALPTVCDWPFSHPSCRTKLGLRDADFDLSGRRSCQSRIHLLSWLAFRGCPEQVHVQLSSRCQSEQPGFLSRSSTVYEHIVRGSAIGSTQKSLNELNEVPRR